LGAIPASAAEPVVGPVVWGQSHAQAYLAGSGQNITITSPGVYTAAAPGASADVDASLSPSPTITISATSASDYNVSQGEVTMNYTFEVVGPASTAPIPIVLVDNASVSTSNFAEAFSTLEFNGAGDYLVNLQSINGVFSSPSGPAPVSESDGVYHFVNTESVAVGEDYSLFIFVEGSAEGWTSPTYANAFLDPYIYVDPTFPLASEYSIIVSESVGNAPAAPEPSTWVMAGLGFGALGALGLARRRRSLVAPART
jgi:MYXO-CTERM domain-containing protein